MNLLEKEGRRVLFVLKNELINLLWNSLNPITSVYFIYIIHAVGKYEDTIMVNNCVLGTIFQHSLANMIFLDNNCIWSDSDLNLCLSVLWMDYSKYEWSLGSCILEGPHF